MVGLFLSMLCGPPIFLINVCVKSINVEGFVFSIICFSRKLMYRVWAALWIAASLTSHSIKSPLLSKTRKSSSYSGNLLNSVSLFLVARPARFFPAYRHSVK